MSLLLASFHNPSPLISLTSSVRAPETGIKLIHDQLAGSYFDLVELLLNFIHHLLQIVALPG